MFWVVGLDWLAPVGVDSDANLSALLSKLGLKTFMTNCEAEQLVHVIKTMSFLVYLSIPCRVCRPGHVL